MMNPSTFSAWQGREDGILCGKCIKERLLSRSPLTSLWDSEDEELLEYLKATDVLEEGDGGGSPLHKRIEVGFFTEAAIIVEIGLGDAYRRCDGAAQGWCGDARSWRSLNGSTPDVGEWHGAWDDLAAP